MNNFVALREKLDHNQKWPLYYMFKFIVPAQMEKIALVESLFDEKAVVYHKESKSGRFISITAKQYMENSKRIIEIYQKASTIGNVMAL
jgi:uncharacterized protein